MKNIGRLICLVLILGAGISQLFAQFSNPFAGQSYRGMVGSGKTDFHFYIGGGLSNFALQPLPLVGYSSSRNEYALSESLDMYLGVGYYISDIMAIGLETGASINWNESKYRIEDIARVGNFWEYATPDWIRDNGYRSGVDQATLSLFSTEVPLRLYVKLSNPGEGIKLVALQGFAGLELAFTTAKANFHKIGVYRDFLYGGTVREEFFVPNFTTGARLSLAFLGIEYSYHLGLNRIYGDWDYYKNRRHRLSIGVVINEAF